MLNRKIILIFPKTGPADVKHVSIELPFSLLFLSAPLVKAEFEVKIIDQRIDDRWEETLARELKTRPLCVGVSAMTGKQIYYGLKASRLVKEIDPAVRVVWGGIHPSLLPRQTIENENIDIVCIGDGEETFLELATALMNNTVLGNVKGIVYKQAGAVHTNPPRPPVDMDTIPDIPYHLVNVEDYLIYQLEGVKRMLNMHTSRGCPHQCTFCYNIAFNQRRWRAMSAQKTFDLIKRAVQAFRLDAVSIFDDNFFADKRRVMDLGRMIKAEGLNIKIKADCRIDYLDRMSIEELQFLRACGFHTLFLGGEGGSDRILGIMKKEIDVAMIIRVNKKVSQAGIIPRYSFVVGIPTETNAERFMIIDLISQLFKDNPKAELNAISNLSLFPGLPIVELCKQYGYQEPKKLEEWADIQLQTVDVPWVSPKERVMLENMSYLSRFIDRKALTGTYLKRRPLFRWLARMYYPFVKFRWQHHFFNYAPELRLLKFLYLHEWLT